MQNFLAKRQHVFTSENCAAARLASENIKRNDVMFAIIDGLILQGGRSAKSESKYHWIGAGLEEFRNSTEATTGCVNMAMNCLITLHTSTPCDHSVQWCYH